MFTIAWWQLIVIILLSVAFGVYIATMFKHIKNMTNEYDGGGP